MCQGCFDDAGRPRIKHPSVIVAAIAARTFDRFGALHIVVEDWNVEDSNLDYVLDHPETTPEEFGWACHMKAMTEEQRLSALALADGYWSLTDPEVAVPADVAAKLLVADADTSPVRLA